MEQSKAEKQDADCPVRIIGQSKTEKSHHIVPIRVIGTIQRPKKTFTMFQ
ncbi:hypothetical protein AABM38_17415 [Heyndrickxia sp. MSNUG]